MRKESNARSSPPSATGRHRRLIYLPVIHTAQDLGSLAVSAGARQPVSANSAHTDLLEQFWDKVEEVVVLLLQQQQRWRIYQDGLPICDHERQIVSDMAHKGSRNYQLLSKAAEQGAIIMGTESPRLLLEEYRLAKQTLGQGVRSEAQWQAASEVLQARDEFIADRINRTLVQGESGILFLGLLHNLDKRLDDDIELIFPIGQPQLRQRTV